VRTYHPRTKKNQKEFLSQGSSNISAHGPGAPQIPVQNNKFIIASWSPWDEKKNCWTDSPICILLYVKWSRYRPGVAQRVGRSIALLFHDCGTRMGWVVSSTSRPHFTPGKDPVPIVRRVVGSQERSGRVENIVPTGIRSRTVQPVVSCYTDWATGPHCLICGAIK